MIDRKEQLLDIRRRVGDLIKETPDGEFAWDLEDLYDHVDTLLDDLVAGVYSDSGTEL